MASVQWRRQALRDLEAIEARRWNPIAEGFSDNTPHFDRPVLERLLRQPYRDVAFRRQVLSAYEDTCAISGIGLRNGGGRPEVQAAHIRPIHRGGSDSVRNGLALSATVHWMFDRGLIAIDPTDYRVLVSHNKVPGDVAARLFRPDHRLALPKRPEARPNPKYLEWHKVNVFGQGA